MTNESNRSDVESGITLSTSPTGTLYRTVRGLDVYYRLTESGELQYFHGRDWMRSKYNNAVTIATPNAEGEK